MKRQGGDLGFRAGAGGALAEEVHRLPIDVNKIVRPEVREKPEQLLAELSRRVLQTEPPARDAAAFSKFLEGRNAKTDDSTVRGLVHLMMSTPLYQLT
jgi:hypothetical protein